MRSPFDEPGKELLISQNVFEKHHFQNICWFPSTRKREVGVRDGLVDSGRSARPPPGDGRPNSCAFKFLRRNMDGAQEDKRIEQVWDFTGTRTKPKYNFRI